MAGLLRGADWTAADRLTGWPRFRPAPLLGLTGGRGSRRAGGGGENGVSEPQAGVPTDPTGQPCLHHRLRTHHRCCGEQLQCQLLIIRAGFDRVFRKLGFGPWGSPDGLVSGVGGGGQGSLRGLEWLQECLSSDPRREYSNMRDGGSGLQVSF